MAAAGYRVYCGVLRPVPDCEVGLSKHATSPIRWGRMGNTKMSTPTARRSHCFGIRVGLHGPDEPPAAELHAVEAGGHLHDLPPELPSSCLHVPICNESEETFSNYIPVSYAD